MLRRVALCAGCLFAGLLGFSPGLASADSSQTSIMQDDTFLVDSGTTVMNQTLAKMQSLGVQEVRVNLEWANVAPDPTSSTQPGGFVATDPSDYSWGPYAALANAAPNYNIKVEWNLTSPGPLWAMGSGAPSAKASTHWKPNSTLFFAFAEAAGQEFSGNTAGVSRVSNWSIWNEPNQPGWLAPQWERIDGHSVPESAVLYRGLADAGYYGLAFSGHSTKTDTILIGETAPEGDNGGTNYTSSTPLPFLRTLYCVNAAERPLRGSAAKAADCPTSGRYVDFAHANGALFDASGFAHHPYDFFKSPSYSWAKEPNYVPLADISRLETFLNRTFSVYGVHRQIPLYFTEYGYATNPPNPLEVVSPAEQAAYLNEADYMAWSNPRVKAMSQFELYDSAPNPNYPAGTKLSWTDTFQTGLLFHNGTPKPAYSAYRMPIWLPATHVRAGSRTFVWGQVRPADITASQPVKLQWTSGHGGWRTIATVHTGADSGYYTARVKLPASGSVRALWSGSITSGASSATGTFTSRSVPVRVRR